MKNAIVIILAVLAYTNSDGQSLKLKESGTFTPQNKKVILYENKEQKQVIIFKSNIQVNTDGVPTSYHPFDLRGDFIALNTILNGASIYRLKDNVRISNPKTPNNFSNAEKKEMRKEAYKVFEKWRDSDYDLVQPEGYKIIWQNVLIPYNGKPCIFRTGKYAGYFASATALKNDLISNKGECDCNNQVDPFEIPTLVLAGGNNIVRKFGAGVGDLLVAYNHVSKNLVYAVIGDTGPEENLGEGSVILNMKLKGTTQYPKTRKDTYGLATDKNIMVCIIPGSKNYKPAKPYSQQNIQSRISGWFSDQGYKTEQEIISFLEQSRGNTE
jgi:hypothetical protein